MVESGLCSSRAQARQLIESGQVFLKTPKGQEPIKKAAQNVVFPKYLELIDSGPRFVSRGGIKLFHAIAQAGVEVQGLRCVDFGQSTGGFTDCLLQLGARSVVGFDVGHDQLHPSLRSDNRVVAFEGINLKDLDVEAWLPQVRALGEIHAPFDLAVADLSFISLRRVLPSVLALLEYPAICLFLVKPQFELGKEHLGKNGLVKDLSSKLEFLKQVTFESLKSCGCTPLEFFECAIKGGDGNQEFFVYASWQGAASATSLIEEEN